MNKISTAMSMFVWFVFGFNCCVLIVVLARFWFF